MWTVVAMLAVLKAGGAFLLLDPSLPHERLRLMCRKVSAKLSLASEASAPLAKDLVGTVVIVNADSALQLAHHASPITSVRPHTQRMSSSHLEARANQKDAGSSIEQLLRL
ncbi:hypothetical protein P3342_007442 [Pyrenophora teres f. teres]|nr:hypothetical protein P3342_007442 [Pyrenophora teres f. teres]